MAPTSSLDTSPSPVLPRVPTRAPDVAAVPDALDEIVDLTDRRRVLLRAVFGVSVPADAADAVFDPAPAEDAVSPPR